MTVKKAVLVVEDEKNISELLVSLFVEEDCQAIPAQNVKTAITLVESVTFDLITLDLNLPDVSGLTFLEYLIRVGKTVPVVIVSALSDRNLKYFDKIPLVKKVISKPFNISEVVNMLTLV